MLKFWVLHIFWWNCKNKIDPRCSYKKGGLDIGNFAPWCEETFTANNSTHWFQFPRQHKQRRFLSHRRKMIHAKLACKRLILLSSYTLNNITVIYRVGPWSIQGCLYVFEVNGLFSNPAQRPILQNSDFHDIHFRLIAKKLKPGLKSVFGLIKFNPEK